MTELRLAVEPPTTYYDDPFELRVEGVPEGASLVVAAEMREVDGGIWRSSGQYRVGPRGCLEDPMRVVWSAERVLPSGPPEAGSEIALDLTVEHDSRSAAARCVRLDPSVGGGVEPDDPELAGLLYLPPGDSRHPPVLFLGGSEGGFHRRHPALLARHGFAVLSLAYFGHPRRPHLVEVPLEGFERALRWLLGHPRVEGRRAAVIGGSFGGQAAPLVAATYPALAGATVMLSGSGVVTSGIPGHPTLLDNFQDARSPWTFGGRPLDFVSGTGDEFERQCRSGGPVEMRLAFETALRDEAAVARAAIPAEAIDGPLLLLSGGDDRQWPCVAMSEVVVARPAWVACPSSTSSTRRPATVSSRRPTGRPPPASCRHRSRSSWAAPPRPTPLRERTPGGGCWRSLPPTRVSDLGVSLPGDQIGWLSVLIA